MTTPGLLGYSTELGDDARNHANLVLLSDIDLIERWRATSPHPDAVAVSPRYYECVRIYHGSLTGEAFVDDGEVMLDLSNTGTTARLRCGTRFAALGESTGWTRGR